MAKRLAADMAEVGRPLNILRGFDGVNRTASLLDDYVPQGRLDSGAFSTVYVVQHRATGELSACKSVCKADLMKDAESPAGVKRQVDLVCEVRAVE